MSMTDVSTKAKAAEKKKPAPAAAAKEEAAAPAPKKEGKLDLSNKRAICEQFTPYVRSIAGKIKKTVAQEIEFDDLVEYGMIGLLEAADRYDPAHGANFMTFAYYRIR